MKRNILMGTILGRSSFPHKALRDIVDIFGTKKIFVFKIDDSQYLLTYNVDNNKVGSMLGEVRKLYKNTIRLHRKKKNNVFYTINSLNKLSKEGELNWDLYHNCILLAGKEDDISKLSISLEKVIEL